MGTPRPETHRRALVAPAFSSDPAVTGLVGETTADDAIANLDGRVSALEGDTTAADAIANLDGRVTALEGAPAPAGGVNLVDTQQILHPADADFDFIFPGAPASEPVSASFFIASTVGFNSVWVNVVGDVVYGAFGLTAVVSAGLERIPGGLRFKGGAAAWAIGLDGGDPFPDPFTDLTLTIAASF